MTLIANPVEAQRWGGALALVLVAHAAPVLVAAWWAGPMIATSAPEPAILIDMAPLASPPVPLSEQPPGPKQVKHEVPKPRLQEEPVRTPSVLNPAVAIPIALPQPPQIETKQASSETTAPPARPQPPAPAPSAGRVTWQGLVLGRLERYKRYPSSAQSRRQQGVPYIRFVMDRNGNVVSSRLERNSGFPALDDEAVALPKRAQPLPRPPADVVGDTIELVVPVEFFMR